MTFLDELFDNRLLLATGVSGVYLRGGIFEDVLERLDELIKAEGESDQPEVIRFPPAMNRVTFEKSGYLKSFPQLAGSVHSFCGNDAGHARLLAKLEDGEDWTTETERTD